MGRGLEVSGMPHRVLTWFYSIWRRYVPDILPPLAPPPPPGGDQCGGLSESHGHIPGACLEAYIGDVSNCIPKSRKGKIVLFIYEKV